MAAKRGASLSRRWIMNLAGILMLQCKPILVILAALYEPGVEIPSDYQGVAFVQLDNRLGWRVELAK